MLTAVLWFNAAVFLYFIGLNGTYLCLVVLGFIGIRRAHRKSFLLDGEQMIQSPLVRPVSIVSTAFNEEGSIVQSVSSLLQQRYPFFEVVVVNDGSTDRTLEFLIEHFNMEPGGALYRHRLPCKPIRAIYVSARHPRLVVVDKENGGTKGDAANGGINVSRYPLFCCMDADQVLEKDALLKTVRVFIEDPTTVAVGGTLRVVNGCTVRDGEVTHARLPSNYLVNCQVIEYLRSFLFGRVGWDQIGATLIVSGGFGVFNKQAVIEVGGYDTTSLGEDFDLIMRLRKHAGFARRPHRVAFIPDTVCWTEVPSTWKVFRRQRSRWMRGLIQTLWRHRVMILNPRFGTAGVLGLPFYVFFEMLGPFVEVVGIFVVILCWIYGIINWTFAWLFLTVALLLGSLLSLSSVLLMELTNRRYVRPADLMKLVAYSIIDNVGFRQAHAFFRLFGVWELIFGVKKWGTMTRTGFAKQPPAAETRPHR